MFFRSHVLTGCLPSEAHKGATEGGDGGEAALAGDKLRFIFGVSVHKRDTYLLNAHLVDVVIERLAAHRAQVVANVSPVGAQGLRNVAHRQVQPLH